MRIQTLCASVLLLSGMAFCQTWELSVHLQSGESVAIAHSDIQRIEFSGIDTGVEDPADDARTAQNFALLRNYPNPANPSTTIEYSLATAGEVAVRIYNLRGALVRELVRADQTAGLHTVSWEGTNDAGAGVSSGVYLYSVESGDQVRTRKLILVK